MHTASTLSFSGQAYGRSSSRLAYIGFPLISPLSIVTIYFVSEHGGYTEYLIRLYRSVLTKQKPYYSGEVATRSYSFVHKVLQYFRIKLQLNVCLISSTSCSCSLGSQQAKIYGRCL